MPADLNNAAQCYLSFRQLCLSIWKIRTRNLPCAFKAEVTVTPATQLKRPRVTDGAACSEFNRQIPASL